jgi:hypothetical protein
MLDPTAYRRAEEEFRAALDSPLRRFPNVVLGAAVSLLVALYGAPIVAAYLREAADSLDRPERSDYDPSDPPPNVLPFRH